MNTELSRILIIQKRYPTREKLFEAATYYTENILSQRLDLVYWPEQVRLWAEDVLAAMLISEKRRKNGNAPRPIEDDTRPETRMKESNSSFADAYAVISMVRQKVS